MKDIKVYSVKHFWGAECDDPTEHFVSSKDRPLIAQAVKALKLDFEPSKGEHIEISLLHVIPIGTKV